MAVAPAGEDRTAYVAEYVRAFDARHPDMRRTPPGDEGGLDHDVVAAALLLVAGGLVAFGAVSGRRRVERPL